MDYHKEVSPTRDATLVRRVNVSAVIGLIRENSPIARAAIARAIRLDPLGLPRTATDLIDQRLASARNG